MFPIQVEALDRVHEEDDPTIELDKSILSLETIYREQNLTIIVS